MTTLLTRRALGLLAIALVLVAVMIGLGVWQYNAYADHQRHDAEDVAASAPVPLDDVLGPDDGFSDDGVGQPVLASGSYVGSEQIYVTGLDGVDRGYAVVTPLLTDTGSAILVVRGMSDSTDAPVPPGRVQVEGSLQPSSSDGTGIDDQRVASGIRTSSLVPAFGEDLYSGYVVLTSSQPPEELAPVPPPLPDGSRWAGIRNLIYALQWWLFAAFVLFMWWRIAHEEPAEPTDGLG